MPLRKIGRNLRSLLGAEVVPSAGTGRSSAADLRAVGIVRSAASASQFTSAIGKGRSMDHSRHSQGMTRRAFGLSFGPGMYVLGAAVANGAAAKKVPTSTGIDALYVPFVVAAALKFSKKNGRETASNPFANETVPLDAILTGSSKMGA